VGILPIDAIFSPVRKVNYSVERTRVGQITDYERLVLEVWTDGTIKPVEAVREAADNLVNHFFLFTNIDRVTEGVIERPSTVVSPEIYQTPIERLDLSPRTLNCLKRAHITKVGEVLEMPDEELLKIRNFGEKSLVELRERLIERGITPQRSEDSESSVATAEDLDQLGTLGALSTDDLGDLIGGAQASVAESADASPLADEDEADDEDEEQDDTDDPEDDEE